MDDRNGELDVQNHPVSQKWSSGDRHQNTKQLRSESWVADDTLNGRHSHRAHSAHAHGIMKVQLREVLVTRLEDFSSTHSTVGDLRRRHSYAVEPLVECDRPLELDSGSGLVVGIRNLRHPSAADSDCQSRFETDCRVLARAWWCLSCWLTSPSRMVVWLKLVSGHRHQPLGRLDREWYRDRQTNRVNQHGCDNWPVRSNHARTDHDRVFALHSTAGCEHSMVELSHDRTQARE